MENVKNQNLEEMMDYIKRHDSQNYDKIVAKKISEELYDGLISMNAINKKDSIELDCPIPLEYEDYFLLINNHLPSIKDHITMGNINDGYHSTFGNVVLMYYNIVNVKLEKTL